MEPTKYNHNKQLITLTMITLSRFDCTLSYNCWFSIRQLIDQCNFVSNSQNCSNCIVGHLPERVCANTLPPRSTSGRGAFPAALRRFRWRILASQWRSSSGPTSDRRRRSRRSCCWRTVKVLTHCRRCRCHTDIRPETLSSSWRSCSRGCKWPTREGRRRWRRRSTRWTRTRPRCRRTRGGRPRWRRPYRISMLNVFAVEKVSVECNTMYHDNIACSISN